MAVSDRNVDATPQQGADSVLARHIGPDHTDVLNEDPVGFPEKADFVLGRPVDEQVGYGTAVAIEGCRVRIVCASDRLPTVAIVPVVVV